MLSRDESKLSVIVFVLTEAERSAADCWALDVSAISIFFCVRSVLRLESEKSLKVSCSVPSVVLSSERAWVSVKSPDLSIADELLREPDEKSYVLTPAPERFQ